MSMFPQLVIDRVIRDQFVAAFPQDTRHGAVHPWFIPTPPAHFEPETRTGCCLCGSARFEYRGVPLEDVHVLSCDCNVCTVLGPLNCYSKLGAVTFTKGSWKALGTYKCFNEYYQHDLVYHFCTTCGSLFGGEFADFIMINARLFDGIDVSKLTVRKFCAKGRTERLDADEATRQSVPKVRIDSEPQRVVEPLTVRVDAAFAGDICSNGGHSRSRWCIGGLI
ncbi:hypothetical protein AURDEDRAFT_127812 [Auricularia subglabra TFB-10046 SS5]|uniref:CENP-V/GFA domain-containing protein n=1 Tax=Auricularia subglabra (strain TFB-10046 / SS5) TaxID=717982 RepID=J0WWF1_AURST|nr:hypothetical protein AURDEDRAFT_127812 [Auricularia subglabra TFB-10046 SS5]